MSPRTSVVAVRDPMTRQLVTAVLTRDGLSVFSFGDAEPAWQRLTQPPVHLLVCEGAMTLPGWQERLGEARESNPELRTVLLKGPQLPEGVDESGFDAVVELPFRYGRLRERLRRWGLVEDRAAAEHTAGPEPQAGGVGFAVPPPVVTPDAEAAGSLAGNEGGGPDEPDQREPRRSRRAEQTGEPTPLQIPTRGDLRSYPAARIFFELRAARFSGKVELWRWGVHHAVRLRDGFVVSGLWTQATRALAGRRQQAVAAETPATPEPGGLARLFRQQGRIDETLVGQTETLVRERGCSEADALIYSGAVTEWDCLTAIQARIEAQMVEVLTWDDGTYKLGEDGADTSVVQNYVDPIKLIGRAVRDTMTPDHLLDAFAHIDDRYVVPTERLAAHLPALRKHLDDYDPTPLLDGQTTFGEALRQHDARANEILRWLYVLLIARLVEPAASPRRTPAEPLADQPARSETPTQLVNYGEVARMCELIGREHARVQQATAAEALGVTADATPSEVLRAYHEAEQRLSPTWLPDGLPPDMRRQAGRLLDRLSAARDALLAGRSRATDLPDS